MRLGDGDERGQHDRADVQHARAVHVVELEALHLRAVDQRGVRRGEALAVPQTEVVRVGSISEKVVLQNSAPLASRAVERAAERVEHQQLDPLAHVAGTASYVRPETNSAMPRVCTLSTLACSLVIVFPAWLARPPSVAFEDCAGDGRVKRFVIVILNGVVELRAGHHLREIFSDVAPLRERAVEFLHGS